MDKHKGTFVGAHLYDEELEKLSDITERLAVVEGRKENRADTLRWIIRNFDMSKLRVVVSNGNKKLA